MNMGFQISQEDVETILVSHKAQVPTDMEAIMCFINDDAVSNAALSVDFDETDDDDDILDKQTQAAYDEIAWQLYQAGFISEKQIDKYGNTALLQRVE